MHSTYSPLFAVDVHHRYYAGGQPGDDVALVPTPETARMVQDRGFICRRRDGGIGIYAEVTSDPQPELLRPAGQPGLRFAFTVHVRSPYLGNITELPEVRPGRQVLCFDNLRDDVVDGTLHLGDSIADSRLGSAVRLETGSALRYALDPPAAATTVEAEDRFGAEALDIAVASPDPAEPIAEARIEEEWDRLPPGRYRVFHGGDDQTAVAVYKGPGIERGSPLGVVEIYDRTNGFAADGVNRVPAAYRFLDGDRVTPVSYRLQLEPRSTTWKYIVVNKHRPDETDLATLTISGAPFTRQVQGDRATFTSDARRALSERPDELKLEGADGPLLDLPTPGASTPLEEGAGDNDFVSPMYIYV